MSAPLRTLARRIRDRLRKGRPASPGTPKHGVRATDLARVLGDALHGLAVRDGRTAPLADGPDPLTREQLSGALDDLAWHLQDLFTPFEAGPDGIRSVGALLEGGRARLDLGPGVDAIARVTVRNEGTREPAPFAWVFEGEDTSTLESLAALAGGTARTPTGKAGGTARTPAGKAASVLRFVRDRRYHGPPPTGSRDDVEAADPVSFFNHFGYGLCGNAANTMAVLCALLDLEARVVNLQGHTVVEVRLDDEWCCFDPDAGTAYVEPSIGPRPLSLARVSKRAREVVDALHLEPCWQDRRAALAGRLADREGHRVVATGADLLEKVRAAGLDARDRVRPGERIELLYRSRGPWLPSPRLLPAPYSPPAELAHARSVLDLTAPGALGSLHGEGVHATGTGLRVEAGGSLILEAGLAGPLVDATLRFGSEEDRLAADVSVEALVGDEATPIHFEAPQAGPGLGLRTALVRNPGRRARIRFGRASEIETLTLEVIGQRARLGLPRLGPGANGIVLSGVDERAASLHVEVAYDPGPSAPEPRPLFPPDGAEVPLQDLDAVRFDGSGDTPYEIQLSSAPDFEESLGSNLDRRLDGTSLAIGDAERALLPSGDVYWRVRRAESVGLRAGPWSETARFRIPVSSAYVRSVNRVLDAGQGHWTLGAKRIDGDWFDRSGAETARWLIAQGIEPGARCVELGCGSLRVGRHLMGHLDPGRYVGLDLTERFYREALDALDSDWIAERGGRFAEIGPDSIERFAAEKPDFVVSTSVVMHVPVEELDAYFANVARLIAHGGVALVTYKETSKLQQTARITWGYPAAVLLEAAKRSGLDGETRTPAELQESAGYEDGARLSVLRLRPA